MKILKQNKIPSPMEVSEENLFKKFRNRNMMILGWVFIPLLFPFAVKNIIQGQYLLGVLTALTMVIALLNSISIKKKDRELLPSWIAFLFIYSVLLYAITSTGDSALFWFYPFFFVVFFLYEPFVARIEVITAFVILVPYTYYLFGFDLAIRFSFSLFMLCFYCDLLVGIQTRLQDRMTELVIRDSLTSAFNRRHMNSCIQTAIEEAKRGLGPVSLLMLDIDHFKNINDSFGHESGDQVLKQLVSILHKRQRRIDYVFRAGGEEFVVMLRNTELKEAVLLAEELRNNVEEEEWIEDQKVTISLGAAQYQSGESADDWLKRADDQMYEAKKQGRNRVFPVLGNIIPPQEPATNPEPVPERILIID